MRSTIMDFKRMYFIIVEGGGGEREILAVCVDGWLVRKRAAILQTLIRYI